MYADESERRKALSYSRTKEWLAVADLLFGAAITFLSLSTGLSARLRSAVERISPRRLGPLMPFAAAGMILSSLVSLPLSFYGGYIVEHRFELSNQSIRAWFVDWLKGLGLGIALGAPLLQGAFWIIGRYPRRWWAVLSGLVVPFSVLLANLAPVLLMPLFNKFEPVK